MPDNVYKVIELVGTSEESLGEGGQGCGRARRSKPQGLARR